MTSRDDLLQRIGVLDRNQAISRGKSSGVGSVRQRADQEWVNIGAHYLTQENSNRDETAPAYPDPAVLSALADADPSTYQQKMDDAFSIKNDEARDISAEGIREDEPFQDGGNWDPRLLNVGIDNLRALYEEAQNPGDLMQFEDYVQWSEIANDQSQGRAPRLTSDQVRALSSEVVYADTFVDRKSKGWSDERAARAARLNQYSVVQLVDMADFQRGANLRVARLDSALQASIGPDWKNTASQYIAGAMQSTAATGDPDKEIATASMFYEAHTGHGITRKRRSFTDIFP